MCEQRDYLRTKKDLANILAEELVVMTELLRDGIDTSLHIAACNNKLEILEEMDRDIQNLRRFQIRQIAKLQREDSTLHMRNKKDSGYSSGGYSTNPTEENTQSSYLPGAESLSSDLREAVSKSNPSSSCGTLHASENLDSVMGNERLSLPADESNLDLQQFLKKMRNSILPQITELGNKSQRSRPKLTQRKPVEEVEKYPDITTPSECLPEVDATNEGSAITENNPVNMASITPSFGEQGVQCTDIHNDTNPCGT